MSFSAAQWSQPNQTKFLSQTNISSNLHQRRSKTQLHASKARNRNNDEASISERLAVFEDLDGNEDLELVSGEGTVEAEDLLEVKKENRNQKRNDSFTDEAARLTEIDAHLFCGNVR